MEEWMEAKQFRRSKRRQILMVKWKMRWKKLLTIFIAYILIVLFALLPKISSIVYLCIETDTLCQLQINCHFHFINFPTVSSLLHIGKILVHWPFLEISGPQKWVVGATLALKQKFLAGTLEFKISWCNLLPSRHVLGMCELSLKSKPFLVVISFNWLLTSHNFVDALRSSLCPSSFFLRLMSMPCCCKNLFDRRSFCILYLIRFSVQKPSHSSQEWNIIVLVPLAIAEILFFPLISTEVKKRILDKKMTPQFPMLPFRLVCVGQCPWCS